MAKSEIVQLDEFITETLKQLIEGVKNAQAGAKVMGGAVNPKGLIYGPNSSYDFQHKETTRVGTDIEFDLEITATESKEKKEGVKVPLIGIKLGVQRSSGVENRARNRVKFKVPVLFPKSVYEEKGESVDK